MDPIGNSQDNRLSIFKRRARLFSMIAMMVIIAAIPFTVYIAQQRQEVRQRAAWDTGGGENSTSRCGFGISCPTGQTCVNYRCVALSPTVTQTITPSPSCIPYPSPPACAYQVPPCYVAPLSPDLNFCPPTSTPPVTISPSVTTTPTVSLSPSPSSPTPTSSITPTPTISPFQASTRLAFELVLSGVGPNGGNQNPKKPNRLLHVQIFGSGNREVANKSVGISFDPQSQTFKGVVEIENLGSVLGETTDVWSSFPVPSWGWGRERTPTPTSTPILGSPTPTIGPSVTPPPPGGNNNFLVKVKTKRYLRKIIDGITTLNIGTLNRMPITTLVIGDINDDNKLTVEDYNVLIGCFASKANTSSCTDKENADLDDDDSVGGVDLNLFLRSLSVQEGD